MAARYTVASYVVMHQLFQPHLVGQILFDYWLLLLNIIGVNPLATISALSERSVDLITKKNGLSIDLMSRNEPLNIHSTPKVSNDHQCRQDSTKSGPTSIGWQFTETLSGHIYMGPNFKHDELFEDMGRDCSCAMQMLLTIEICKNRGKTIR